MKKEFKGFKFALLSLVLLFAIGITSNFTLANSLQSIAIPSNAQIVTVGHLTKGTFTHPSVNAEEHWYKFSIPKTALNQWYNIELTNLSSCAGTGCLSYACMYIYDSDGKDVDGKEFCDSQEKCMIRGRVKGAACSNSEVNEFEAGKDYYIRITGECSLGDYTLGITTKKDDNYGTYGKAKRIICNQKVNGVLEYTDDIDTFCICLPKDNAKHNILLTSQDSIEVSLLNSNTTEIDSTSVYRNYTNNSLSVKGKGQKIFIRVNAGSYAKDNIGYSIKVLSPKKNIKVLKLGKYKKKSKKIVGKTISNAIVKVKIKNKTYTVKSNKKGNFTVRIKGKLKSKFTIKISVSKSGYKSRTKTYKIR